MTDVEDKVEGFMAKQDKIAAEIADVLERNGADIFEAYRVLSIMAKTAEVLVEETLDKLAVKLKNVDDAIALLDEIMGVIGQGESE